MKLKGEADREQDVREWMLFPLSVRVLCCHLLVAGITTCYGHGGPQFKRVKRRRRKKELKSVYSVETKLLGYVLARNNVRATFR